MKRGSVSPPEQAHACAGHPPVGPAARRRTDAAGGAIVTLDGCTAVAGAAASAGGAASIEVAAGGLSTSLTLQVWHPAPLSLQLDDATLNRLDGCAEGGDGAYQARSDLPVISA